MKPDQIEITIDRLVVEGMAPSNAEQLGYALEQELSRLFETRGVPEALTSGGDLPHLEIEDEESGRDAPGPMGRRLAESIYRQMKHPQQMKQRQRTQ